MFRPERQALVSAGSSQGRALLRLVTLLAIAWALTWVTEARAAGALPAPGEYAIDTGGSSVEFGITEFLFNTVHGKFTTFGGKVVVGDSLASTRIDASVDVASVETGVRGRDEHLRAADYFDAARFPAMTFTSSSLWGTPENFGIKGNLTIKGTTKEVVFRARILDSGVVLAEAQIDRTAFGITAGGVVKNEVTLHLHIRLKKLASSLREGPGPSRARDGDVRSRAWSEWRRA